MKKFFTLLTMCCLAAFAWGETVIEFIPGETKGSQETVSTEDQMENGGVTIHTSYGAFAAAQYRMGKNSSTTITSSVGNITQIEFFCTKDNPASGFSEPVLELNGNDGTWTGNAAEVTFVAANKQVRATKIVVTIGEGGGVSKPKFTPAAGTYYEPINVTITCGTTGAKIYYTTDGSNPSTSSQVYSSPIALSTTTTIKAIASLDGEDSDVATAEYVFETATPVANIAAYQALADGTVTRFTNPVNVLAQNGSYLYVKDNTGYGLIYGTTGQKYNTGDVIPAGFVGTKITYNAEPELQVIGGFLAASGNNPINPETITTAQVGHNMFAHYVYMEGVTIDPEGKTLTDAVGTAPIHFSMGVTANQIVAGEKYKVWAIVGSYQPTGGDLVYQLLPVKVQIEGDGGNGIGNMARWDDNTALTMDYDVTVLYQYGSYLYGKDQTGYGLIFGTVNNNLTYNQGDVIPAGFSGTKTTYNGEPELAKPLAGFQAATRQEEVTPEVKTPNDVNHDNFAHLVVLKQVLITPDANPRSGTLTDVNGNTCAYFNNTFYVPVPSDLTKRYDVVGIVGSYGSSNTVYQLLPTDWGLISDTIDVANFDEIYAIDTKDFGRFTEPLTAIYQNGKYLYALDADGEYGLIYGNVGDTYNNGDIINAGCKARWTEFQGAKQLTPVTQSFTKGGTTDEVEPIQVDALEDVATDMVHQYVYLEGVINPADKDYTISDETSELTLYNKFGLENIPADGAVHKVWAFVCLYYEKLEICPISIDQAPVKPFLRGDVNGDGEISVADINLLVNIVLGGEADADTMKRADVNEDKEISVADINVLVELVLNS